ncbi:MAG TPA: NADH-quinone oxidoreductase subunit NuoK [Chloroflexota bacterium]|nr:NADH-quinone oxidoreductase subunit NuoK [Chloroflexota bacterium]
MPITFTHYLILSALLFSIGLFGVLAKRNVVAILMCVEVMMNAVNIALVAISHFRQIPVGNLANGLDGQVLTLFVITVAAAEASVALAIILAIYRGRRTVNVDEVNLMKW